jgi:hypothetical protein
MEGPSIPGVIRGKLGCQSVMIFQQGIHEILQLLFAFKLNGFQDRAKKMVETFG